MESWNVLRYTVLFLTLFFWVTFYLGLRSGNVGAGVFLALALMYTVILGIVW